jgi:hypothetical protein
MKENEKQIYIKIRAEVIKHFHDTRNAGKFKGEDGFCIKHAMKLEEKELSADIKTGYMRITLDELLLNSLEDCFQLIQERNKTFVKLLLEIENE